MKTTLIEYLTTQVKRKEYESSLHASMLEPWNYFNCEDNVRITCLGLLEGCQLEIIKINKCIKWLENIK